MELHSISRGTRYSFLFYCLRSAHASQPCRRTVRFKRLLSLHPLTIFTVFRLVISTTRHSRRLLKRHSPHVEEPPPMDNFNLSKASPDFARWYSTPGNSNGKTRGGEMDRRGIYFRRGWNYSNYYSTAHHAYLTRLQCFSFPLVELPSRGNRI